MFIIAAISRTIGNWLRRSSGMPGRPRLVLGVGVEAELRLADVEADHRVVRLHVLHAAQDDLQEAEHGVHQRAVGEGQRREREVPAIDEARPVDEHEERSSLGHGCRSSLDRWPPPSRRRIGAMTTSRRTLDPYAVLGVPRDATPLQVARAHRRLAKRHHPDLHEGATDAAERMRNINEAWWVLSNPVRRAEYDRANRRPGCPSHAIGAASARRSDRRRRRRHGPGPPGGRPPPRRGPRRGRSVSRDEVPLIPRTRRPPRPEPLADRVPRLGLGRRAGGCGHRDPAGRRDRRGAPDPLSYGARGARIQRIRSAPTISAMPAKRTIGHGERSDVTPSSNARPGLVPVASASLARSFPPPAASGWLRPDRRPPPPRAPSEASVRIPSLAAAPPAASAAGSDAAGVSAAGSDCAGRPASCWRPDKPPSEGRPCRWHRRGRARRPTPGPARRSGAPNRRGDHPSARGPRRPPGEDAAGATAGCREAPPALTETGELVDHLGAPGAGGDVRAERRVGDRIGLARGQRCEALVVRVVRNQHAYAPDVRHVNSSR